MTKIHKKNGSDFISIEKIRKKKGFSQAELAELVGVDRTSVVKWESRKNYPRVEVLIKLSKILDCSIDELIKERDEDVKIQEKQIG